MVPSLTDGVPEVAWAVKVADAVPEPVNRTWNVDELWFAGPVIATGELLTTNTGLLLLTVTDHVLLDTTVAIFAAESRTAT